MDQQSGYQFIKKALQFLVLVSFFSFLYSYFSGFPLFSSNNLQFSTLIFPLFAHALDRKYMFLICNGILAFLAKNLSFSSSSLNNSGFMKSAEDGVKQITELPAILKEEPVEENVASMEYAPSPPDMAEEEQKEQQQERDYADIHKHAKEIKKAAGIILECEEWEEEEDDDDELKENKAVDDRSPVEEINDSSVSTEELNQKFEEFIRKMKEEIRTEAQQQLITM